MIRWSQRNPRAIKYAPFDEVGIGLQHERMKLLIDRGFCPMPTNSFLTHPWKELLHSAGMGGAGGGDSDDDDGEEA